MDFQNVPWDKGIEFVLAVVLLKFLFDAVYRKIPRGLRRLNASVVKMHAAIIAHDERTEHLIELMEQELDARNQPRGRSRRRRARGRRQAPGE